MWLDLEAHHAALAEDAIKYCALRLRLTEYALELDNAGYGDIARDLMTLKAEVDQPEAF